MRWCACYFAGSPLGAWLILLVTLALIIGIWRIASRRTGRNVASATAPLGGSIASRWSRLRRPAECLAASVTGASGQTGLLDPRGKDGGATAGRARVLSQRPEWGPQLSVLLCVCPQRHAQSDALTSALLALRWQLSQLRQQTGYAVPLALQGQVGSAMSRDLLWQAAIPGEAVKVWQPSCAPCSVPARVAPVGRPRWSSRC